MLTMGKKICVGLAVVLVIAVALIVWGISSQNQTESAPPLDCLIPDFEPSCYSTDPSPYRLLGKKTIYKDAVKSYTNMSELPIGNCKVKVFYLLCRHATRNPDREEIEDMLGLLPTLREKILESARLGKEKFCELDLERIRSWSAAMTPDIHKMISETGHIEAEELAKRFKERFPVILSQRYNPQNYIIEYTSQTRTRTTAEAFAKGLFSERDYQRIDFENKTNDRVLTFNLVCKPLLPKCPDPNFDMVEISKSKDANWRAMRELLDRVSRKVGFRVTSDEILIIYNACIYAHALGGDDTWCTMFSAADLKILEFQGDIWDYYKDAYGNEINYAQACPIAEYVYNLFKSNMKTNATQSVLHFTRSSAIRKVYPVFGLFDDGVRLKADEYCSQADRQWKSSVISPFDSNIAFVLMECGGQYKIATFQNEKWVHIKGCRDKMCDLQEFYRAYEGIAAGCDLNKICCPCCNNL